MDYKIKRLADGGGFASFTPIIHTAPAMRTPTTAGEGVDAAPASSSIIDDKMLESLYKSGGLVNDVNKLVSELIQLEKTTNVPYTNGQNRSTALQLIGKINEINQNKKYWDDAITRSKEGGGFGEVAVNTDGRVFTKDRDNKIQSISLSEYNNKRSNVKLLSVAELLYERQYNPTLTGQNAIFNVADNAIGLNKITDHIKTMVAALGTESVENSQVFSKSEANTYLEGMQGKAPTQDEMKSLVVLNKVLSSPSEYSQVETKSTSERNQLNKALSYIWSTLGTNAQQKLSATAALNGVSDPKKFIWDMLETETSDSISTKVSAVAEHTAQGKAAPGTSTAGKVALTPSEMFHMDRLYQPGTTYTLNNPDAGVKLDMVATGIGPLYSLDKDGAVVAPSVVSNILTQNNYQAILNQNQAYIGDSKVDPTSFGEMAFSGDDVAKVYVPVRPDGSPDLAGLARFKEIYNTFQENKDKWSAVEAERWFAKNDFGGIRIQEIRGVDGSVTKEIIENNTVKPFLAIPILTNSASELSDNPWMVKLTGTIGDNAKVIMDRAFTVFGGTASKPTQKNLSPSGLFSLETPYKSTLFMAYRPDAPAVLSSMHKHLMGTAPSELDVQRNLYNSQNSGDSVITAGASVL